MKKPKRKKQPAAPALAANSHPGAGEDRGVLAATVLWMLTILCSLAAEIGGVACVVVAQVWPAPPPQPQFAWMAAAGLLVAALVTGLLCLVLTPLVWRLRPVKPPLTIVLVAVLVGVAPPVTLIVLNLLT